MRIVPVPTRLNPYRSDAETMVQTWLREVARLAEGAAAVARVAAFDVIHAHDWMTYPAAGELHGISGKPWIAHVHSTEFARSGEAGDAFIEAIERDGVRRADRVICVSRRTADVVHRRYGVPATRIRVVHNAIDDDGSDRADHFPNDRPLVLFVGRLTRQKSPACFLEAAGRVLAERADVEFVIAGAGDRLAWLRARAAELGIADRVSFPGFLAPARAGAVVPEGERVRPAFRRRALRPDRSRGGPSSRRDHRLTAGRRDRGHAERGLLRAGDARVWLAGCCSF